MTDKRQKSDLPILKESEREDSKIESEEHTSVETQGASEDKTESSDQATGTDEGFVSAPHTSGAEATSDSAAWTSEEHGGSMSPQIKSPHTSLMKRIREGTTQRLGFSLSKKGSPESSEKPKDHTGSFFSRLRRSPRQQDDAQTQDITAEERVVPSDEFQTEKPLSTFGKIKKGISFSFKKATPFRAGGKAKERETKDPDDNLKDVGVSTEATEESSTKTSYVGTGAVAKIERRDALRQQSKPSIDSNFPLKVRIPLTFLRDSFQRGEFRHGVTNWSFASSTEGDSITETSNVSDSSSSLKGVSGSCDTAAPDSRISSLEEAVEDIAMQETESGQHEGHTKKAPLQRQKRIQEPNESSDSEDEARIAEGLCASPRKRPVLLRLGAEDNSKKPDPDTE